MLTCYRAGCFTCILAFGHDSDTFRGSVPSLFTDEKLMLITVEECVCGHREQRSPALNQGQDSPFFSWPQGNHSLWVDRRPLGMAGTRGWGMCHQPTGWASKQPCGDAGGSEPGVLKGAVRLSPPLKAGFSLPSSGGDGSRE